MLPFGTIQQSKTMKKLLFILSLFFCSPVFGQFTGIIPTMMCWNGDSTILRLEFYSVNTNNSSTVGSTNYWDLWGNQVTVSGGVLRSGACSLDTVATFEVVDPNCNVTRDIDQDDLTTGTTTYTAGTLYSWSISVIAAPVSIIYNGVTISCPAGFNERIVSPHPCEYITDQIQVTVGSGGRAIVSTMQ